MNRLLVLLGRWLVWLILVSFESVVGFPWLSMYLAAQWVFGFSAESVVFSLLVMSPFLAAAYSLPLTVALVALLVVWLATLSIRWNTWQRWGVYLTASLAIGLAGGVRLSLAVVLWTLISWLIFLTLSGNTVFKRLWQKKTSHFLSKP